MGSQRPHASWKQLLGSIQFSIENRAPVLPDSPISHKKKQNPDFARKSPDI